ncbi:MAG: prepilin-type N-terminal cleavage/methylation domain-containing protein, partial [Oscillospiraceae bacterium]|nr:prepilin-type N-terminal cleavage/methylation domain-containing protein [Oscillospiraceae bacterium]
MKKYKGFTLTEVVCVLVVGGIVAAAAVPGINGYIKHSKAASCKANTDELKVDLKYAVNSKRFANCEEINNKIKKVIEEYSHSELVPIELTSENERIETNNIEGLKSHLAYSVSMCPNDNEFYVEWVITQDENGEYHIDFICECDCNDNEANTAEELLSLDANIINISLETDEGIYISAADTIEDDLNIKMDHFMSGIQGIVRPPVDDTNNDSSQGDTSVSDEEKLDNWLEETNKTDDGTLVGFTLDKDNNVEWICYYKDYDGLRYFITTREGGEPVIEYIDIQENSEAANYVPPAEGSLGSTVYKSEWTKGEQTRSMKITKYVGNVVDGQISEDKEVKWTQRDKDWYIESWQEYPIVEPDKSFICSKRKPVKAELSYDDVSHKYNMVIHYDDESSIAIDMITANHIDIVNSDSSESRRVWYLLNGYIISDNKMEDKDNWTYAFDDGSLKILEDVVDNAGKNLENFENLKINELYFLYQETYKFYENDGSFKYEPITVDSKLKRTLVDSNILLEKDGFYPQGIFDITIHNGNESAPTIIEDNVKALIPFYDDAFKSGYYFTESSDSDSSDLPDSSETKKEKYDATEVKKIADRGTADFEVWYVESESSQPVSLGSVERVFDAGRIVYENGEFVPKGDFHTVITKKNNNETETITNKPEECELSYYDAILDEGYYFMSLDENDDYKYNAKEISELVKEGQVNFKAYYEIDEDVFEIGVVNSKIDSDIVYIEESKEYCVKSTVVINQGNSNENISIEKEVEYFNDTTGVGYYFEFTDDKGKKITSQEINERFEGYTGKVEVYHQYDADKEPIYCGTIERVLDNAELVYGKDGKFAPMGDFHTEIHNYDDDKLSTTYKSVSQRDVLKYYYDNNEAKEGYYFKNTLNNQLYTADKLNDIAHSEPVDFEMYYVKSDKDEVIGTITSDVTSTLVETDVKNEFAVNSKITVNYENKDNSENKGNYTFDYDVNYYDETSGIGYYYTFDGSDDIIQPEELKARFELYTDKVNVYHRYSEHKAPIEVGMIKRELTDKSTELVYDANKRLFVPMGSFYTSIENYAPEGKDIQMCGGQPEKRELQYFNEGSDEGYYFVDAQDNKYNAEDASRLIHSRSAKFEVCYKDANINTKVGSTQSIIASEIVRGKDNTYPVVSKITIDYTSYGKESSFVDEGKKFVIDNTPVYYDSTADNYYYYKWSDMNGDIITIDNFEYKFANYTGKVDVYHQYAKDEEPLTVGTVERVFENGTIRYTDGQFVPVGNFHTDIQNAESNVNTGANEECVLKYYNETIGEGYYFINSDNSGDTKKYTAEEVSKLAKNKPVRFNAYYAVAGKEESVSIGAVVSTARASVAYDNTTDKYTVTAIFTIKYPNGEDVVSKVVEEYNETNKEGYYFEFTGEKGTKSTQEQLNNRFEGFTGKAEIYYQCGDGKTVVKAGEVERILESTELTYENEVFVPKGTFHTEVRSLDGSQSLETIYTSEGKECVLSYYDKALDEGYYFEDASGNKYTAETATALIKSEPSSFGVHYKDGENIKDIGNVESSISSAIERGENHTYPVTSTITVKYGENSFTVDNTPVYYDGTSKNYYYYKWSDSNGDMITVGEFAERFANYTGKVDVYHQYAEGKEPLAVGTVERVFENGTIKYTDGQFVPVGNFRTDIQNAELEVNTGTSEECVLKYYNETIGEGYYFT